MPDFDQDFFNNVLGRVQGTIGDLFPNFLGGQSAGVQAFPNFLGTGDVLGGGDIFTQLGSQLVNAKYQGAAERANAKAQAQQAQQARRPAAAAAAAGGQAVGGQGFLASVLPWAEAEEARTGVPAILNAAVAANETGNGQAANGGQPWNSYHGIRGTGSAGSTPAGFRANNTPQESFADFANLISADPTYAQAWASYQQHRNPQQLLSDIANAGYEVPENRQRWVNQVGAILPQAQAVQAAAQSRQAMIDQGQAGPNPQWGGTGVSQYDLGLPQDVADAFCGPSAAIWFAQRYGRTPSTLEAMNLAKEVGWNTDQGMAGVGSEVTLLNRLGIPAVQGLPDTARIIREVQAGRPVIINTPGHYFQITGYNAQTGGFTFGDAVGRKAGAAGATLSQLSQFGFGAPDAAIYYGGQ